MKEAFELWPKQRKEWESIDSTSEENTDDWGIVYDIKDPEVMPGDYRGSTGTQAKTSATDSRNLVQSCEALKTKEAYDAARCCLKLRADRHQGDLRRKTKANDDFNKFFTKFLGVRGNKARVSTIIRPRAIALCKPGQSLAPAGSSCPSRTPRSQKEKIWKLCAAARIVHAAVVVRVVARSSSYFHTGGEGGSF